MQVSRFLVTGGSQGIGAAIVEMARKDGHEVVFTGRNQQLIEKVAQKTGAHGLRADVSVADDNARTVETCLARMGGIDVLVNNAGYAYRARNWRARRGRDEEMFETNVFGLVDITNRVVPLMKSRGAGDIVNIASTSGMKGAATATAYAASKWAVTRHQPVLAGGAASARDSGRLCLPVRSPDPFWRPGRPQQSEQALRRGHRRDDHGGAQHATPRAVAGAGRVCQQPVEGKLSRRQDENVGGMSQMRRDNQSVGHRSANVVIPTQTMPATRTPWPRLT